MKIRIRVLALTALGLMVPAVAEQRRQDFDRDPGWEGKNNRGEKISCRTTSQDFGYAPDSAHAGGERGEIGGFVQMAGEPAWYAKRLRRPLTLKERISASGKIAFVPPGSGPVLIGFFNSKNSIAWRTRNSLAMRLDNRGDCFHAHIEYATDRWRAGAGAITVVDPQTGKADVKELPLAGVHRWSFEYDPEGNHGQGSAVYVVDDQKTVMDLSAGHKADGAAFDRFGMLNVMKSCDNRVRCYVDDVVINGAAEDFSREPGWEGVGNHASYEDCLVRPRFNFGFSPTRFAGGGLGELGGIVFRGDDRDPDRLAYYGDRIGELDLRRPLAASGRVSLTRGVSDSTALIGWFNAERSLQPAGNKLGMPAHFLGVMVEGPSSEGFLFRPAMASEHEYAYGRGPVILPNGQAHKWSVRFEPTSDGREGTVRVTLDGESAELKINERQELSAARFNRFGIVTTRIDGNYQFIYFDDLEYTCK